MLKKINPFLFPWFISIIATIGSLFFSEVMKFTPCTLCWYQRILMYPLTILFTFGFFKRDKNIFLYTYPMILAGNLLSLYHYCIQKISSLAPMTVCTMGVPCSGEYINWFGFITIPFLSFVAFTLLHIFFWIQFFRNRKAA